MARGLLEDAGLVVDLAEDGLQALEFAKQNTYALILMGMKMPHPNGVEATQAIRTMSADSGTWERELLQLAIILDGRPRSLG
jgi:CheY-like chemotaxis protein